MARSGSHPCSVHPGIACVPAILRNLEPDTGKGLDAWVCLVQNRGPKDENACPRLRMTLSRAT